MHDQLMTFSDDFTFNPLTGINEVAFKTSFLNHINAKKISDKLKENEREELPNRLRNGSLPISCCNTIENDNCWSGEKSKIRQQVKYRTKIFNSDVNSYKLLKDKGYLWYISKCLLIS